MVLRVRGNELCGAQQDSARQTRHGIRHRYPLLLLDTQGRVFSWHDLVFCGVFSVMPDYRYEALDPSNKSVTGKIESSSANYALKSLINDGLRMTQIIISTEEPIDPGLLTDPVEKYVRLRRQVIPLASAIIGFFAGVILTAVISKTTSQPPNEIILIFGAVIGAIVLYALSLPGLPMRARLYLVLFLIPVALLAGIRIMLDTGRLNFCRF